MYRIFFIHSSLNGHLSCFHVLAIVISAAKKVHGRNQHTIIKIKEKKIDTALGWVQGITASNNLECTAYYPAFTCVSLEGSASQNGLRSRYPLTSCETSGKSQYFEPDSSHENEYVVFLLSTLPGHYEEIETNCASSKHLTNT